MERRDLYDRHYFVYLAPPILKLDNHLLALTLTVAPPISISDDLIVGDLNRVLPARRAEVRGDPLTWSPSW